MSDVTRSTEPHDRLTRIGDRVTVAFYNDDERLPKDKCIVFLEDGGECGGLVIDGYDDDFEAMVNLLIHLRAMFRANGQDLELVALDDDGVFRA